MGLFNGKPKGSLWKNADHPGFKNKADEARGGSRKEIAMARIRAIEIRREKQLKADEARKLKEAAKRIRAEQDAQKKARKQEQKDRVIREKQLRELKAAQKRARQERKKR